LDFDERLEVYKNFKEESGWSDIIKASLLLFQISVSIALFLSPQRAFAFADKKPTLSPAYAPASVEGYQFNFDIAVADGDGIRSVTATNLPNRNSEFLANRATLILKSRNSNDSRRVYTFNWDNPHLLNNAKLYFKIVDDRGRSVLKSILLNVTIQNQPKILPAELPSFSAAGERIDFEVSVQDSRGVSSVEVLDMPSGAHFNFLRKNSNGTLRVYRFLWSNPLPLTRRTITLKVWDPNGISRSNLMILNIGNYPDCHPNDPQAGVINQTQSVNIVYGGETSKVFYTEEGEYAVDEDMILGTLSQIRGKSFAYNFDRRWPIGSNGVVRIPYRFSSEVPASQRVNAVNAMTLWEDNTSGFIDFMPRTNQADYVTIRYGTSRNTCFSDLGKRGGEQFISMTTTGCSELTMIHEIGHTLGYRHEHKRGDRNSYIKVGWCNLPEDGRLGYLPYSGTPTSQYDFDSVMHYTSRSRSTLESINTPGINLVHGDKSYRAGGPSTRDVSGLYCMYGIGTCE